MGKVKLNTIKVYAHHGCLSEETIVGSDYLVDVTIKANLKKAAKTDDLRDTVDYVHLNHIVKKEMQQAAKLLEHVAQRIIDRILTEIPMVETVSVSVSKINPPIGGDVAQVSVILKQKRK